MNRILLCLCIILLCGGCKYVSEGNTSVLKDIWRLEQAQINSFDPADAYHAYHIQLTKQLFNTLTDIDTTGKLVPSLANAWHSDDGRHWTFELRDDVFFIEDSCFESTEDRLFTAGDVKYTFERLLAKNSQSFGVSYFTNILGVSDYRSGVNETIQGIEVIDKHTVKFLLAETNYNFPNLLSLPYCSIIKEKAIRAYDSKVKPIGTGPFQLETYLADRSISLVRNKDYWENLNGDKVPYVQKVDIILARDDNYSFLLFKNKKSDFVELNTSLRKQNEATRYKFKTHSTAFESTQLNFYLFNLSRIDDPNVRKGINYAIDRGRIRELIGKEGKITNSLYPRIFKELSGEKDLLKTNVEKAQELLSGRELNLKLVVFDDILSRALAAQVKKDLAGFDISVEIEPVSFPVLADRLSSGEYDMIQLYWGMLYADPDHFLTPFKAASFPPEGNNFNKYTDTEFEELIKEALRKHGEEQVKLYLAAEDVILEDMPFLLLYYKNINLLSNTHFKLLLNPLLFRYYKYAKVQK